MSNSTAMDKDIFEEVKSCRTKPSSAQVDQQNNPSVNSNITGMNNQMKEQTEICTMVPNTQGNFMFNGINNNGMPMNGGSTYMSSSVLTTQDSL